MIASGQSRVVSFIRENRAWNFHPTREKTRRACVEILSRVPPSVRDFIIDNKRLLVVAPGVTMFAQVNPYEFDLIPEEIHPRFQIVLVMPQVEKLPSKKLIGFVVKCIAAALQRNHSSGLTGKVKPEELATLWGFGDEVRAITTAVNALPSGSTLLN